jgi:hypothetical protein
VSDQAIPSLGAAESVPLNLCPFDEAVLAMLEEFRQQAAQLEAAKLGAVRLWMRQQGLTGEWTFAPDFRGLVRKT